MLSFAVSDLIDRLSSTLSINHKCSGRENLHEQGDISPAALEALDYINEILAELEANEEQGRIAEITAIKKSILESVKVN